MKKVAVLSITAFYLLLTTGMFVCLVHCAAENMVTKPAMQSSGMMAGMQHKNGKHAEDCNCCKKHANFIVKENLKPGFNIQFAQTAVLVPHARLAYFLLNTLVINNAPLQYSNAPPVKSGKAISIQFRSLLI